MTNFKDHFSGHASDYQKYRPGYPDELFEYLAGVCENHDLALDVGTGNGQAAVQVAKYFSKVIATDPSENQISNAPQHDKIEFQVSNAENCPVEDQSLDLLTVAQALHWFDFTSFFKEVNRVLKPGGILAVWAYGLSKIEPEIDEVIENFYENIVGPYWPDERKYIEEKYQSIDIPFSELNTPNFQIELKYDLHDLMSYLNTWSAVKKYINERDSNPLNLIHKNLSDTWGDADRIRSIKWPVYIRTFRNLS